MENQFVTFDIALALKELGFDEPCMVCFINEEYKSQYDLQFASEDMGYADLDRYTFKKNSEFRYSISAPLWQQVIDWFREKHNIEINVYCSGCKWNFKIYDIKTTNKLRDYEKFYSKYYEALIKAIEEAIKLLNTENLWKSQEQVNLSK